MSRRALWALLITCAGCSRAGFSSLAPDGVAPRDRSGDLALTFDTRADGPAVDRPADRSGADRKADGVLPDAHAQDAFVPPNRVFITSTSVALGSLGALASADAICQARASAAGLAGTYVAWLSSASQNARDRLGGARGWVRIDGKPVADTLADLVAGKLWFPIAQDELGQPKSGLTVATGTLADGTAGKTCSDWSSTSASVTVGDGGGGTEAWTAVFSDVALCGQSLPLLCFGVDRVARVTPPAETGRRAFLLAGPWSPAGGLTSADARCAADATAAGLSGTYRALLATTSATAASRFDTVNRPLWVRVDGTPIAESFSAFLARKLLAPIDVTAAGAYVGDTLVWAGASGLTLTPTSADNCADWTVASGQNSYVGRAGRTSSVFFGTGTAPCSFGTMTRLYCLEL
jgi:hypothetical protein